VKPLDEALLHDVCKRYKTVVTVEDGCLQGGMGSAVLEFMADNNYNVQVIRLGIPDEFIEHGEQAELWSLCKYDTKAIIEVVRKTAVSRTTKIMAS